MAELPKLEADLPPNVPIEKALQQLLATKHLYQSTQVDFEPAVANQAEADRRTIEQNNLVLDRAQPAELSKLKSDRIENLLKTVWMFDPARQGLRSAMTSPTMGSLTLGFSLPPIKTFCGWCRSKESFNLLSTEKCSPHTFVSSQVRQFFSVPVQCQACKASEIVFLVTRDRLKLTLTGRSEFEEVQVPAFVPKGEKRFYSQAVIAYNSGHFLPALFLLRTLIEQHMRATTKKGELRGDDLCDEYASSLPDGFKQTFPSLKSVYGNLSDVLHRADESKDLFDAELRRIDVHFQGLEAFAKAKE